MISRKALFFSRLTFRFPPNIVEMAYSPPKNVETPLAVIINRIESSMVFGIIW